MFRSTRSIFCSGNQSSQLWLKQSLQIARSPIGLSYLLLSWYLRVVLLCNWQSEISMLLHFGEFMRIVHVILFILNYVSQIYYLNWDGILWFVHSIHGESIQFFDFPKLRSSHVPLSKPLRHGGAPKVWRPKKSWKLGILTFYLDLFKVIFYFPTI